MAPFVAMSCLAAIAQWPQFGGPNRDFTVTEDRLDVNWPKEGPKRIWSRPLGDGYSSILVDDGLLFTMYRETDEEIIAALKAATGASVWQHRYAAPVDAAEFAARYGHGPRSTPLIAGDRIFAIGFNGRLTCLDKKTGTAQWTVDLPDTFDAKLPRWGYANSPIAFENNIIVPVGGKSASIVALDQSTGRGVEAT
ncbi:MAG: PQQ-binding-like beta-propeller repeat protein [Planctomycetes bacterium]|nr:PQQ-binding-like beta-propeller repeat protein [Planctomycetota bacterium]